MKSNSRRHGGFGLIEVVISMAIMAIVVVSVYNAYILAIKHTKAAQVKQEAALEGKKVIEEIKSTDIQLPANTFEIGNGAGVKSLEKYEKPDHTVGYRQYLNEDYKGKNDDGTNVTEASAKYTEIITINPTKSDAGVISFNNSSPVDRNDINYKINISKEQDNGSITDYIEDGINSKHELQGENKIILSLYLEKPDENHRNISIKNYNGELIFDTPANLQCISGKVNINLNFNNYKQIGSSTLKSVVINIYNLTSDIPNVYVEKSNSLDLNVDVEIFKGQMNKYDNRAEDSKKAKIGTLYDIEVEIRDYLQNKNYEDKVNKGEDIKWEDRDNLFTAYYKKNIQ